MSIVRALLLAILVVVLSSAPPASAAPPWAACGASAVETKPVQSFPARQSVDGLPLPSAVLMCGNGAYEYRHIAARHRADWEAVAFYTGGNWRDLADFAIRQTLAVPQPGYPAYNPKNDTWSYKAPVQIKGGEGNVRTTYWPLVSVAARDGKIITSFPTRDPR